MDEYRDVGVSASLLFLSSKAGIIDIESAQARLRVRIIRQKEDLRPRMSL